MKLFFEDNKELPWYQRKALYLDPKSKFNEDTFDEIDLFDAINEFLGEELNIPCDDFKGDIYCEEDEYESTLDVSCNFEWIFYPDDISIKEFKQISDKIETALKQNFNTNKCECVRYNGPSQYSESGYDVSLKLEFSYDLDR